MIAIEDVNDWSVGWFLNIFVRNFNKQDLKCCKKNAQNIEKMAKILEQKNV